MTEKWRDTEWAQHIWYQGKVTRRRVVGWGGGAIGAIGAYIGFDGFTTSTINWQTFSQVAFAFKVSPQLLVRAITWAAFIGLFGGLFPAIRAARIPIAAALRET